MFGNSLNLDLSNKSDHTISVVIENFDFLFEFLDFIE